MTTINLQQTDLPSVLQVTCSYNNDVLKGVTVILDDTSKTTKSNGLVTFTNLNKKQSQLVCSKDGYLTVIQDILIEDDFQIINIEMQPTA